MGEGRKPEYSEKTPDDELQKIPHSKARKFKPQTRLEPALKHWWQARKADVLTVTPRVAPLDENCCGCIMLAGGDGGGVLSDQISVMAFSQAATCC